MNSGATRRASLPLVAGKGKALLLIMAAALLSLTLLTACASSGQTPAAESSGASTASNASGTASTSSSEEAAPDAEASGEVSFPTGWLIIPNGDVEAGVPVELLYLPGMDTTPRRNGKAVSQEEARGLEESWGIDRGGFALIRVNGQVSKVDPALLLVNLPDILQDASYDCVYSYASTSKCASWALPGVTGQRLEGYADGKQEDAYLGESEFVVPCAYATAVKLGAVNEKLKADGYRLLVYDIYRPVSAQYQLSESFQELCANEPGAVESLGEWSTNWYVASGPSGHNYGTEVDAGVCLSNGTSVTLPSAFDAFDETGHLTEHPVDAAAINPDEYRDAVKANDACLALHRAFADTGFSELASEWWHFADGETEAVSRSLAGDAGLDFMAELG